MQRGVTRSPSIASFGAADGATGAGVGVGVGVGAAGAAATVSAWVTGAASPPSASRARTVTVYAPGAA